LPADHPLAQIDQATGLTMNDKLRAVHDLFGHDEGGFQFGPRGEENAWLKHSRMFPPEAIPALTTETKGQNSWVNFGKHVREAEGKIAPADRPFAEQKAGLLPKEFYERPLLDVVHYSDSPDITELDPMKYGTASYPGAERQRYMEPQFVPRTYVGVEGQYKEPKIQGRPFRYVTRLEGSTLYDIAADPKGLWAKAFEDAAREGVYGREAASRAEQALRDAGYTGYKGHGGAIASFQPVKVEPTFIHPDIEKLLLPEELAQFDTEQKRMRFNREFQSLPEKEYFIAAAKAGSVSRKWYERSAQAFDALNESQPHLFKEGDKQKFMDFVAALSPQQPVTENLRMGVELWRKWSRAGRPLDDASLKKLLKRSVDLPARYGNAVRALKGEPLSGPKVSSFSPNLLGEGNKVTNDTWMAVFSGRDPAAIGRPEVYNAMSARVREAAKELGWKPAQAQAAVWGFVKTLAEVSGWGREKFKPPTEVVKLLSDELVAQHAQDFADILRENQEVRSRLSRLGVDIDALDKALEAKVASKEVEGGTRAADQSRLRKAAERLAEARTSKRTDAAVARHLPLLGEREEPPKPLRGFTRR